MDNPPICDVEEIMEGKFDRALFLERLTEVYEKISRELGHVTVVSI